MKAEERHRLQENDLHRLAEHARERTRPFFDRFGVPILLGLAAVLIVIAGIVWWSKGRSAESGEGWEALATAFRSPDSTAENFAAVADAYPESKAAVWARLYEGESRLGTGVESLFSEKEGAIRDLEDAQTAFETVLEQPDLDPAVKVRGLYGLARTLEAASDGDLQPAIDRYEEIVNDYPETVYENLAQQRLDALKSPEAKEFYAWFSKAQPTLQDPLLRPQDGAAPTGNPFDVPGGPAFPTGGGSATPTTEDAPSAGSAPVEAPKPQAAPAASAEGADPPAETEPATSDSGETPATDESAPADGGPSLGGKE